MGLLTLSLISVKRRISYPVVTEQLGKDTTATPPQGGKRKGHGKRGRPKGSKNQHRRNVELSPYLRFVQEHIHRLLTLIGDRIRVLYFVFDGALGSLDELVSRFFVFSVRKVPRRSA